MDITNEVVIVRSFVDIVMWCKDHDIAVENFNQPVEIPVGVEDCSYMFNGCISFNQPVEIPAVVKDHADMLLRKYHDFDFNQPVKIPDNIDCGAILSYLKYLTSISLL